MSTSARRCSTPASSDRAVVEGLLAGLAAHPPAAATERAGWRIVPVLGGANNRLYRLTGPGGDFAAKFCLPDERDRAGREFAALTALRAAGRTLAPEPVRLERERFALPVVVRAWVEGAPIDPVSLDENEWETLVEARHALFGVDAATLPEVVLTADQPSAMAQRLQEQRALLAVPPSRRLTHLLDRFGATLPADWPPPRRSLCHGDSNPNNLLRTAAGLKWVDWEYAGRGDPAFEIAEWRVQPEWRAIPESRWQAVTEQLAARRFGDPGFVGRVDLYARGMRLFWGLRLTRMLDEVPRGGDARLAERAPDWESRVRLRLAHFLQAAE